MTESTAVDRAALAALYQRYGRLVHRRAARILGDEQLAHDVCHDVFVQILRTTPWAPPSPLAWLYVTTTNLCLNLLRSDRRRRRALAQLPQLSEAPTSTSSSMTTAGELSLMLRRLPEDLQDIAVYYAVDQLSQAEIALILGVSQKTVSNRLHALRELIAPAEPASTQERKQL
jgi:RNA polymerase sigma-70 factor (ECF subfamily)